MLNAINYATRHFCTDVFGYEIKEGKSLGKDLYGASIPLYKDDIEFQFYLYFKKETLELFVDKLFYTLYSTLYNAKTQYIVLLLLLQAVIWNALNNAEMKLVPLFESI